MGLDPNVALQLQILVMQAGWNVVKMFLQCENVSPDTCAAGVVTQTTDVLAFMMRFFVQLLLNRGTTWPSSLNALTTTWARM